MEFQWDCGYRKEDFVWSLRGKNSKNNSNSVINRITCSSIANLSSTLPECFSSNSCNKQIELRPYMASSKEMILLFFLNKGIALHLLVCNLMNFIAKQVKFLISECKCKCSVFLKSQNVRSTHFKSLSQVDWMVSGFILASWFSCLFSCTLRLVNQLFKKKLNYSKVSGSSVGEE